MFFSARTPRAYTRQKPELIGAPDWLYECMATQFRIGANHAPAGGIALLENASVTAGGVVLTDDGRVVEESLLNTEDETEFGLFTRERAKAPPHVRLWLCAGQRRMAPQVHILLKQTFDDNYGHWIVESLPRLALVARAFDVTACKVIVSDTASMREVYLDSLRLFGILPSQVEHVGFDTVHVDKLIYPLPITTHPWTKSPAAVEILERVADLVETRGREPRRIYVSRNRYHKRRLVNEDAILEVCVAHEFEIVHPEMLSFADQVRMFRNAEFVIGNCGAALSNIAFAPRGSVLLALTSEHMHDSFFWDLASLKGITYVSLHGKATTDATGLPYTQQMNLDFTIAVERFSALLAHLMGEAAASRAAPAATPIPEEFACDPPPLVTWH